VPISGNELLVLLVLAAFLIGPERLPGYVDQIKRLVRGLRTLASGAQSRIAAELGTEAADVDWSQLDPRRYDPRRIVREALLEDVPPPRPQGGAASSLGRPASSAPAGGPAPFDDEAT
jgi:sec-independent protein translocase protein TatB